MKYVGIKKVNQRKFVTLYDIEYRTEDDKTKIYEMMSRKNDICSHEQLFDSPPDAVVIIMHTKDGNRILLNCEYRMAVGEHVYNFPAGLIDPGESPEEAAARELCEETGLHIDTIEDFLPESYSAVGFSNEKNVCVIGTASGEFAESTSTAEEITPGWYTKEICELLGKEHFAARTQAYCYMWSKQKEK